MARWRSWHCPDCGGIFKHFHHPDSEPPPNRCPLCDAWVSDAEPAFTAAAPALRNAQKVKAVEDVYYAMESGSRSNAEAAAQMLPGVSASDLRHMHINDSKPNVVTSDNQVAQRMAAMQQVGIPTGFNMATGGGHNIPAYNNIPQGGLAAQQMVQSQHFQNIRRVMTEGNQGSYKP